MRNLIIAVCAIAVTTSIASPALAKYHHGHDQRHDWNWERSQYTHNWHKVNADQQRELDAEMRAQWLAYHHNKWNGNYNWSMYRDPRFMDYLHRSNPSLLTRLRTVIGF